MNSEKNRETGKQEESQIKAKKERQKVKKMEILLFFFLIQQEVEVTNQTCDCVCEKE